MKNAIEVDEMEIKNFAKDIASSPYLVDLIASCLWPMTKMGINVMTDSLIDSVASLKPEEEKEIPIPIVLFLKANICQNAKGSKKTRLTRVRMFIEEIRKNVIQAVNEKKHISCEDLAKYSQIFNMKYVKDHFKNPNTPEQARFIIAIALGENDYNGILVDLPKYIDYIYDFFKESISSLQMKNLLEAFELLTTSFQSWKEESY